VTHQILKASDYGAATIRKRLIVVGIKSGPVFAFPNPSHGNPGNLFGLPQFITAGEALEGLPAPFDSPEIFPTWHQRVNHTQPVIERFAKLLPGEQDKVRKRWRLSLDQPGPSLVAGNLLGIRSHIHPTEPRELTNRESARIHAFPDNFQFFGNYAFVGKQIANSVPIPLARALGQAIADHLDKNRTSC
jgi:DNA (cytosine-5)-methyltransferase 1